MVNKELVSFKADIEQLVLFDSLCFNLGIKREYMLDFLIYYACHFFKSLDDFNILVAYSRVLQSSFKDEDNDIDNPKSLVEFNCSKF